MAGGCFVQGILGSELLVEEASAGKAALKGWSAGDARPVAVWPGAATLGRRMSGDGALGKGRRCAAERPDGVAGALPWRGEGGRAAGRRLPVVWGEMLELRGCGGDFLEEIR